LRSAAPPTTYADDCEYSDATIFVRIARLNRIYYYDLGDARFRPPVEVNSNPITGGADMADVQITCINKLPRDNSHEGITHFGGATWKWTRQQVVDSINSGSNTFYTLVDGKRANVGVVDGPNGRYVRTHADGYWNDNLLALPECG
jgi:Protein of unknown function (DUF3892)